MNEFIKFYNDIFVENGYVQISAEDLRISNRIVLSLQKYNDSCPRKDRILKKLSFTDKYKKLKNTKCDSLLYKELVSLFSFKDEYEKLDSEKRIKENEINKKREYIKNIIQKNNTQTDIHIIYNDILYDANTVTIEKVETVSQFSKKLNNKGLLAKTYYRGQQNLNWPVKPSIFRHNWIKHEKELIEELLISNPHDFENAKTTLERLTKMQHYNAPTRLLDLTKNPYIALYFACEKNDTNNYGEIVFFTSPDNENEKYFDSDAVSIVSNLAMMPREFDIGDDTLPIDLFNQQNNTDIPYLLHQIKYEKPHFLDIIDPKDLHRCFIVHVKLDNKRIINQQGLFLLVGMGSSKSEPAEINKYIYKINSRKIVFVVPNDKKQEIISTLNTMNINKRTVYPEIDDVADYLKNEVFKD